MEKGVEEKTTNPEEKGNPSFKNDLN